MRPHPRIRKAVKWGGLVLAVLLATAWTATLWKDVYRYDRHGSKVLLTKGCVQVTVRHDVTTPLPRSNWNTLPPQRPLAWLPAWNSKTTHDLWLVPLWFPFLLVAVPTALVWRSDIITARRVKMYACPTCSYPRAGLAPSSPCPECGSAAPSA
ncbi:MAG TPA: hypothetical protein VHN77_15255 [Phycisphaerales bacterium]|nr:hypothetical protein [Phycisphaerales bacterium]